MQHLMSNIIQDIVYIIIIYGTALALCKRHIVIEVLKKIVIKFEGS